MSHLVENMAYVGRTPWHGLGNQLASQQPLEVWRREAGMDWDIRETPVRFISSEAGALGQISSFPDQKVLFRSDTQAPPVGSEQPLQGGSAPRDPGVLSGSHRAIRL